MGQISLMATKRRHLRKSISFPKFYSNLYSFAKNGFRWCKQQGLWSQEIPLPDGTGDRTGISWPCRALHFISSEERASPLPSPEMTLTVFSLWSLGERCKAEKSLMNQKHIPERTNEATWQSCQMVCWGLSGSWHRKGRGVRQATGLSSLMWLESSLVNEALTGWDLHAMLHGKVTSAHRYNCYFKQLPFRSVSCVKQEGVVLSLLIPSPVTFLSVWSSSFWSM